jgi:lipopolysaccharide assembly outer membrane protein LptD (OstA)
VKLQQQKSNCVLCLAAMASLAVMLAGAETPLLFGKVTDFKVPEYYEAPNQKQLKSLLRGAIAEPNKNSEVKITDLRVETYREDGSVESVVEAPECIYNYKTRQASSTGHIQARTGDDRMSIEGDGFQLTITNKSLTISNNIHTVIRDLSNKPLKP